MNGFKLLKKLSKTNKHLELVSKHYSQRLNLKNQSYNVSSNLAATQTNSLVQMARDFTQQEIIPQAAELDKTGAYPLEIMRKAHAAGLMNLYMPSEYGGLGISYPDSLLMIEEIGYGCTGVGLAITLNALAGISILNFGTEEQKNEYLRRLTSYPSVAAFCTTEPGVGSDVASLTTRAELKGDEYIINGEKSWITNAKYADWYYVLARTDLEKKGKSADAFTAFILEKDTPGLMVGKKEENLGQKCSDTRSISFQEVRVSKKAILGGLGNGFKVSMFAFDYQRPSLAAMAIGLARRVLDEATQFIIDQDAKGLNKSNQQGIQFKFADMLIGIESARLTYLKAAHLYENKEKSTQLASLAKCLAGQVANKAAQDAVDILGEFGCSANFPVEKLLRDAKIFHIYGGTEEIQKIIIAREHFRNFK
jgi:PREDICTED: similar to acyl-coenzyme A dehydrogenase, C-4 to C-12 straight chain